MTSSSNYRDTGGQTVTVTKTSIEHATPLPTKATALAMLSAPLLLVAAELTSPINDSTDSSAQRVADILDHSGRYTLTVLCLLAGMLLLIPALLGLRRSVPGLDRRPFGPTLAAAGFMLFAVASGALGIGPSAWATLDEAHRASLVQAFHAMDQGKGAMPIVQWGPILALLGLIVVAVSLWRHSSYPRWASVALALGWAVFLFAPTHAGRTAGALVLLAGFMPLIARQAIGRRPVAEKGWRCGYSRWRRRMTVARIGLRAG
jgi:hypothetical protein